MQLQKVILPIMSERTTALKISVIIFFQDRKEGSDGTSEVTGRRSLHTVRTTDKLGGKCLSKN